MTGVRQRGPTTLNYLGRSLYSSSGMRHIIKNDNKRDVKKYEMVYVKVKFREENYQKREEIVSEFRGVKVKENLIKMSI